MAIVELVDVDTRPGRASIDGQSILDEGFVAMRLRTESRGSWVRIRLERDWSLVASRRTGTLCFFLIILIADLGEVTISRCRTFSLIRSRVVWATARWHVVMQRLVILVNGENVHESFGVASSPGLGDARVKRSERRGGVIGLVDGDVAFQVGGVGV